MSKYLLPDVLYMFVDFVCFVLDSRMEMKVRAGQKNDFPVPKQFFFFISNIFPRLNQDENLDCQKCLRTEIKR